MRESRILILIPAWNEAQSISEVIQSLPSGMPVLVVDDGSTDHTAEIANALGTSVYKHEVNQGKGVALMSGFKWALARDYDAVITLDADGQHDPQEIPIFLNAFHQGESDLIIGRRSFKEMPFPRNYANAIGSWMLSKVLRTRIHDNQSGFRLYRRKLIEELEFRRTGFEFEVDVILQALQHGLALGWVDISTIYRANIRSHFHPLRDTLKFFGVLLYAFRAMRQKSNMKSDGLD